MQKIIKGLRRRANFLTIVILGCVISSTVDAQTPLQIMAQIYQKYDSVGFITFDIKYVYSTDTLYGDFHNEVLAGSYTIAGKKAKYNIGDIEFMQNDSFFIAVYNKDKFILVTDPRTNNTGSELPLRQLMDSLLQAYSRHYTITTAADTVTGTISFIRADSLAQFSKFLISYDLNTNFLTSIQYGFEEQQVLNPDDTLTMHSVSLRHKNLTVAFSNYRVDNFSQDSYSENNYIWFEEGECKAIDKYKDYKVYNSRTSPVNIVSAGQ